MERVGIAGVCLTAMFVCGAMGASSASAALPEYKTCDEANKEIVNWVQDGKPMKKEVFTGAWETKECTSPDLPNPGPIRAKGPNPGPEGRYEVGAWNAGKKVTFDGKGGVSRLRAYRPEAGKPAWTGGEVVSTITCTESEIKDGKITGPKTSTMTITFKHCTKPGGEKCTSAAPAKPGEIITFPLEGILEYNEGATAGLTALQPAPGQKFYTADCGPGVTAKKVSVYEGAALGVNSNFNAAVPESTQRFAVNAAFGQEPSAYESTKGGGVGRLWLQTYLEWTLEAFPSSLEMELKLKGERMMIMGGGPGEAGVGGAFGQCVHVAAMGAFANSGCTDASAGDTGEYEWHPGAGQKPKYTDKTGLATLTGAAGVIECKSSAGTGEITGIKTDKEQVLFSNCSTKGAPCTTVRITGVNEKGEPMWTETTAPGTIETFPLVTEVIDHGEFFYQLGPEGELEKIVEPPEGEAWTLFTSSEEGEENPYKGLQAVYECKEVARIFTAGALAGVTTNVNKMETNLTTAFEEGKGLQNLFSDAEVDGEPPLIPIGRGTEKALGADLGEEKNEIRTENVEPSVERGTGF